MSENYSKWKKFHKLNSTNGSQKEYEVVEEVRSRFSDMETARRTSCYWQTTGTKGSDSTTSGSDWVPKWDQDDKIVFMYSQYGAFYNGQSDIKSPMTTGRLNAFLSQYKKLNYQYGAAPNNKEDTHIAKIAEQLLAYTEKNTGSKSQRALAVEDAVKYGSGFFREQRILLKRKQRFAKVDNLTKEEKEQLDKGQAVFGEEEETVIYDSPTSIYVPIRELFWDPMARVDHGEVHAARDVIWRRVMSVEDAKEFLKGIPGTKNVDKIKKRESYTINDPNYTGFFAPPSDVTGDYCEVIEYENTVKDKYRIVVNDICCLDTPLPWNHKQLSFHKLDYRRVPGQFYGKGLCDELRQIQGATEVLANLSTDYKYRAIKPQFIIGSSVAGELNEDSLSADTSVLIVDDSNGANINNSLTQVRLDPITNDMFALFDIYERWATVASGIDPSQLSLLTSGKTATATLQNREQLLANIGGVIDNFMEGGFKSAGRQRWRLIMQYWKLPKVKDILGAKKGEKVKNRTVRLDNIEIKLPKGKEQIDFKESVQGFDFLELKDGYLDPKEEIDIFIRADSVEIESELLKQQKAQQVLAQYAPFMVDPSNPQSMAMNPNPYVNGPKLMQYVNNQLNYPEELLVTPEENEQIAIDLADEHVTEILSGKNVAGEPGASMAHRKREAQVWFGLQAKSQELDKAIIDDMEKQMENSQPMFDQMGQPIPPEPNPMLIEQKEKVDDTMLRLSKHMATESFPSGLQMEAIKQASIPTPPGQIIGQGQGQAMPQGIGEGAPQGVPMPDQSLPMGAETVL